MDFVPILIAILFGSFDGFSLLSGEEGQPPRLYHYSSLPAGTQLTLQCLNNTGAFVDVKTVSVSSENYNVDFPAFPVRRADFAELPDSCTVTTSTFNQRINYLDWCGIFWDYTRDDIQTYRVLQDGKEVNLWNNLEVSRFIQNSNLTGNLRTIAREADLRSENRLVFSRHITDNGYERIVGQDSPKAIGGNGKACPSGSGPGGDYWEDQADFEISFQTNDFVDNINFFDYTTYDYTLFGQEVDAVAVANGIDFILDEFFKEDADSMIIGLESYEVWGISYEMWQVIEGLLIKSTEIISENNS